MAKLADALALGASGVKPVEVQVLFRPQSKKLFIIYILAKIKSKAGLWKK
jgi:hypothetical protein